MTPSTVTVPVSNPAHPSHKTWLEIMLIVLKMAEAIGPAVVTVVDPAAAPLAAGLGQIANAATPDPASV